ncbi:hypothetical protein pipiens_001803 [Culex pipiens pipiens]|uniref:Uncharacterized protein n=1 Tax=Culex pipiens pipiens TaxID=38569 RepID=A0ABD1DV77_CULPP
MPKEVLKILFRLCPQLEVLDLQQMAHVDNEVVELACQKMRKLKRLTLDGCPLTDVPAIEQYRSQLEYLRVENCGEHSVSVKQKTKIVVTFATADLDLDRAVHRTIKLLP